jgi:hypothetical protein
MFLGVVLATCELGIGRELVLAAVKRGPILANVESKGGRELY